MKKILFLLFSILSLSACAQTNNTTDTLTVKYIKPLSGVLNITFPDGSVQTTAQKGGTVTTFGFTNTPGISGTVTNLTTSPNLTLAVDTNSKFKTQTQARADTNKLHNEMVQLSNKNWPSGGAGFYPYNGSQGYGTQYLTSGSGDTLLLTRGGTAKNLTLTGITNFTGSIVTSVSSNNAIQGTSGNGNGIVGISTSFFGGNFSSTNGNGIIATSTTSTAAIFQSSGIYPIALFDSATIIKLSIDLHGNVLQANNHTGTITDTLINKKQARALIGSSGGGNIWPSGSAGIYSYNGSQGYGTQYLPIGLGDTIPLARGGTHKNTTLTGVTSLNVGSDATGDLYYRNSSGYLTRLGIGSTGQVLTVSGGLPTYQAPTGGTTLNGTGLVQMSGTSVSYNTWSINKTGVTFTGTLSLNCINTSYSPYTISSNITIVVPGSGMIAGSTEQVEIIGDGTHYPVLSACRQSANSMSFSTTSGAINLITFDYDGTYVWYYINQ